MEKCLHFLQINLSVLACHFHCTVNLLFLDKASDVARLVALQKMTLVLDAHEKHASDGESSVTQSARNTQKHVLLN